MNADWHGLCREKSFSLDGDVVSVQLPDERRHRVYVSSQGEEYLLSGLIAKPSSVGQLEDPIFITWMRNRNSELVGFRIDGKGRLIGEAWLPKVGLTAEEFQLYIRTIAADCDRLESILLGKDAL